jgi:transcriptional regulator with XRE-family HTH domain
MFYLIIDIIHNLYGKLPYLNNVMLNLIHYFCNIRKKIVITKMEKMKDINRIKVVLVEKKRTNKWLAQQLGKDPATVSKWCTNTSQPGLETLLEIARVLEVDIKELLNSSLENGVQMVRLVK